MGDTPTARRGKKRQAVAADADAVTVTCHRCRRPFPVARDRLRELNDSHDPRPFCAGGWCQLAARRAAARLTAPDITSARVPLTRWDKVLLAVGAGPASHKADIVVRAWKFDQDAFGLAGYAGLYPNSNAVIVCLIQLKGRGQVEQAGTNLYRRTEAGERNARRLAANGDAQEFPTWTTPPT